MTRIPSPVRLLDTLSVRRRRRRHRRQLAHGRLGFPNSLFTFSRRPSPSHEVTCLGPLPSFLLSSPPPHGRTTTHTHLRSTSALVRWPNGCVMLNMVVRGSHVNGQIEDEFVDDKNTNLIISSKSTFSYKMNPIPFLLMFLDSILKSLNYI